MTSHTEHVHTGGCHCGQFRITFKGQPTHSAYCHCGDCRRITGAPAAMLISFTDEQITAREGELTSYQSSSQVIRTFCPFCGSSVGYRDDRLPEGYYHVGLFDNPEPLEPAVHAWQSRQISWLSFHDDLPKFSRSSRPRKLAEE